MITYIFGGVRNSASLRSLSRIRLGQITADKREIKDFLKLPSATSFIRKTLYEIACQQHKEVKR